MPIADSILLQLSNNDPNLVQLSLANHVLSDNDITQLANELKNNKQLCILGLSSNQISDDGLNRLMAVILLGNQSLIAIRLDNNPTITGQTQVDNLNKLLRKNNLLLNTLTEHTDSTYSLRFYLLIIWLALVEIVIFEFGISVLVNALNLLKQ